MEEASQNIEDLISNIEETQKEIDETTADLDEAQTELDIAIESGSPEAVKNAINRLKSASERLKRLHKRLALLRKQIVQAQEDLEKMKDIATRSSSGLFLEKIQDRPEFDQIKKSSLMLEGVADTLGGSGNNYFNQIVYKEALIAKRILLDI